GGGRTLTIHSGATLVFQGFTPSCPRPTISCPANITINNDAGKCTAVVTYTVTGSSTCSTVNVVSSPPSGTAFPVGTTTVTSTATDLLGQMSSCSFLVTVKDNE